MGLSKGTLGLKFMNRQAPAAPPGASAPLTAQGPSTDNSTPATAATSARSVGPAGSSRATTGAAGSRQAAIGLAGQVAKPSAHAKATPSRDSMTGSSTSARATSRPAVVHESSLLSFPLLSTMNRASSSSSSAAAPTSSMAISYSSMPLTSAMVSGRRSFGGANIEIEKLNDPSSHQAPPPGTEDKSKAKRPKKADRDAALVPSVRRGDNLSGSKAAKRTADLDQARGSDPARSSGHFGGDESGVGGKKKRRKTDENGVAPRWEVDDDEVSFSGRRAAASGSTSALAARKAESESSTNAPAGGGVATVAAAFARPAGFDGLKKAKGTTGAKKGKGNAVEGDYQWAKRGETRDWDQGKEEDDDDSEEGESSGGDEELMVSSSGDDSDDDDDSEMDEAILEDERTFAEAADLAAASGSRSRKSRGSAKAAQRGRGGR